MTYNVSMGTLNPTIPYGTVRHYIPHLACWRLDNYFAVGLENTFIHCN